MTQAVMRWIQITVTAAMQLSMLQFRPRLRSRIGRGMAHLGYSSLEAAVETAHGTWAALPGSKTPRCPTCLRPTRAATSSTGRLVWLCPAYPACKGNLPRTEASKAPLTTELLKRRAERCQHWSEELKDKTVKNYGTPAGKFARCQLCKRRWRWNLEINSWDIYDDFETQLKTMANQQAPAKTPLGAGSSDSLPSSSPSCASSSGQVPSKATSSATASAPTSATLPKKPATVPPPIRRHRRPPRSTVSLEEQFEIPTVFPDNPAEMSDGISTIITDPDEKPEDQEADGEEEEEFHLEDQL